MHGPSRPRPQVVSRLFPFGRGLMHSYWAGNAWALYAFVDKLLAAALPRLGWLRGLEVPRANLAGGAIGVSRFAVLPQVIPIPFFLLWQQKASEGSPLLHPHYSPFKAGGSLNNFPCRSLPSCPCYSSLWRSFPASVPSQDTRSLRDFQQPWRTLYFRASCLGTMCMKRPS